MSFVLIYSFKNSDRRRFVPRLSSRPRLVRGLPPVTQTDLTLRRWRTATRRANASPQMTPPHSIYGIPMTLHFPNASRNYSPTRHCVCFWGHDSASEIAFHLDEEALCKLSPYANRDEASLLHVFDVNRARIQETASVAYRVRGGHTVIIDCRRRILLQPVHRGGSHGPK
jgi:hypothetical protein